MKLVSPGPRSKQERGGDFFLPDLCSVNSVLLLVMITELVVMVLVLWSSGLRSFDWGKLAIVSLFSQWLALSSAGILCQLRRYLGGLSQWQGAAVSYAIVLLMAAGLTVLGHWLLAFSLGLAIDVLLLVEQMIRNVLIAAVLTGIALRYFYLQEQLRRQHQAQLQARIEALQARIRPHFLFNSMNSIASLIASDPKAAELAVEDLAELFRASIKEANTEVRIENEIDLCRRYLRIEQWRLGDRVSVDWSLDDLPDSLMIPSLTLQPLLENAIYYGIQGLPEGGTIQVYGSIERGCCVIEVWNPLPNSQSKGELEGGNHMAVKNIHHRLQAIYGADASLQLSEEKGKYVARIRYPIAELEDQGVMQ